MNSREAFEGWVGNPLRTKVDDDGNYEELALQMMWAGWRGCRHDMRETLAQAKDALNLIGNQLIPDYGSGHFAVERQHKPQIDAAIAKLAEVES